MRTRADLPTEVDGVDFYARRVRPATQKRQPEEDRKRALLGWLRLRGVYCWEQNNSARYSAKLGRWIKRHGRGYVAGLSDIGGILPGGTVLQVEVKTESGRLSPEQREHLARIRTAGGVALMARSVEELMDGLAAFGWLVAGGRLRKVECSVAVGKAARGG